MVVRVLLFPEKAMAEASCFDRQMPDWQAFCHVLALTPLLTEGIIGAHRSLAADSGDSPKQTKISIFPSFPGGSSEGSFVTVGLPRS